MADKLPQPLPLLKPPDFPAALYRQFEHELGRTNIHLCVADTALREFSERVRAEPGFLKQSVRHNGHRNLNSEELNLQEALDMSYASHVALLLGRMDQWCSRLRLHPFVNRTVISAARGDFLRKALWIVVASREERPPPAPLDEAIVEKHLPAVEVHHFDMFRKMRNNQLHAGETDDGRPDASLVLQSPQFRDVLQCSKTLQVLARSLCRVLVGPPGRLVPQLGRRFGNLKGDRRRNALLSALRQEYLVDGSDAQEVLSELAW